VSEPAPVIAEFFEPFAILDGHNRPRSSSLLLK
jgi:hypothetical protein